MIHSQNTDVFRIHQSYLRESRVFNKIKFILIHNPQVMLDFLKLSLKKLFLCLKVSLFLQNLFWRNFAFCKQGIKLSLQSCFLFFKLVQLLLKEISLLSKSLSFEAFVIRNQTILFILLFDRFFIFIKFTIYFVILFHFLSKYLLVNIFNISHLSIITSSIS